MKFWIVAFAALFNLLTAVTPAQSTFFDGSERGVPAVAMTLKSLSTGASVLAVSLRPGDEDLSLLAYLRLERGVDLTSVYITNGEAMPSDYRAEASPFLIGRRKEEANQAMNALGAGAFFLNNADPGAVLAKSDIPAAWRSYSVRRLTAAIRFLHPHVVIIMKSRLQRPSGAVLDDIVSRLVKDAAVAAAKPQPVATDDNYGSNVPWQVQRIWTRSAAGAGGFRPARTADDPGSASRYSSRATAARSSYVSLRSLLDAAGDDGSSSYVPVWPDRPKNLKSPVSGISIVSPRFSSLQGFIERIGTLRPNQKSLLISQCVQGVDSLDRILSTQLATMNELDKHTLVHWKTLLERLRFLALNVNLKVSVSDSIIAQRQLFFVDVTRFDSSFHGGNTTIYFSPNVTTDWYVNEKKDLTLPLKGPERFRILSAQELDLNYPVYRYGLSSSTLTVPFSYGVYHYEQDRARRYVANFQTPVHYTRTRIIELATPMILWGVDTEIPYRAFNASRDSSRGIFTVSGAHCTSVPETVFVRTKDQSLEGSISIAWSGEPPKGLDTLEVRASGRLFGKVLVKNLKLARVNTRRILLVSRNPKGETAVALKRVYPTAAIASPSQFKAFDLGGFDVVIVDRQVFDRQASADEFGATVMPWVQRGGNIVILPQNEDVAFDSTRFSWGSSFPASAPVELTPAALAALNTPNPLGDTTWIEWVHARAWSAVDVPPGATSDVAITTKQGGRTLVWAKPVGQGLIVYVSLNLGEQMQNLHDGAFQLFSNLLGLRQKGTP